MNDKKDILEREEFRSRSAQQVPEGYFENLQERLMRIPSAKRQGHSYIWYALAGAAAALAIALMVMRPSFQPASDDSFAVVSYEQFAYADLIPLTDPDLSYAMQEDSDDFDNEDEYSPLDTTLTDNEL